MPQQKYLARIHIMKKEKSVPDEDYREILYRKFKVGTSSALTDSQALIFIRLLRDWRKDPYAPSEEMLYKIKTMWHDVYRGNEEAKHLRQFLFNHVRVSDLKFLDRTKAWQVVEALKAMQKHRNTAAA